MQINQDYFSLFGVERSYRPDMAKIRQNYLALQRKFHPDNFVSGSSQEKLTAVQMTSFINDALRIIEDDILRAEYLLKLNGIELPDDSATLQDAEFLHEQLELRERLARLDAKAKYREFANNIQSGMDTIGLEFERHIGHDADKALLLIGRLKFFQKLKTEALGKV